jgi:predicted metal-dependent hydrolase
MSSLKLEQKIFKYGNLSYVYELVELPRKTFGLTVYPDMKILVKVPVSTRQKDIDAFLKKKWRWLDSQLAFFSKFNQKRYAKEYVSGESFLYLGRQHQLIVKRANADKVRLMRGKLEVYSSADAYDGKYTKRLLDGWYKEKHSVVFHNRYREMLKNFDLVHPPELHVRQMPKRWGSFVSKKKIILNPILIQASKDCIDYVITHELCHMYHQNHGKQFWLLLDKKYPDWERVKEKLEIRLS